MEKRYKFIIVAVFILLAVSGCDALTDNRLPEDVGDLVSTYSAQTQQAESLIDMIIAQTLTAMPPTEAEKAVTEAVPPTTTPTMAFTDTLAPTMTPTLVPTVVPTTTPASVGPSVEVTIPTNCRTGPGKAYDAVSVLQVGKSVEIVGRNATGTYWVVTNPGGTGTCWLWDYYAIVSGQTVNVPIWQTPPTPTPEAQTPVPLDVTLKVSVPTNCRVGPGLLFEKVSILYPGNTAKVIAKHISADYWVIENPAGEGNCWLWGYYAILSGPADELPLWNPPATPTPMPTTNAVILQVRVDTYCRVGPGIPYDIVTILRIGKTANVIARNAQETYWVIDNPSGDGHCWVWGYYATVTGPVAELPIWASPPTPTPTPVP